MIIYCIFLDFSWFLSLVRGEMASPLWCSSSSSGCFQRTFRRWCHRPGWCPGTVRTEGVSKEKVQRERAEPAASAAHHCSSVVGCSDGLEPLLPCCVPAHKSAKSEEKVDGGNRQHKNRSSGCKRNAKGRFCLRWASMTDGCLIQRRRKSSSLDRAPNSPSVTRFTKQT